MPNCAKLEADTGRFMALFVGPSGSGKTVAECSFPGPIKVFDFDGRIRGILGAPWLDKSLVDYEYYPPRVGASDKPIYQKINDDLEAWLIMCKTGQNRYVTGILDSLTSETFALLSDAVPLTHAGNKGKKLGTVNMAGPEDYGFEATNTYNTLAFFRSLPGVQNIIVSAHVVERYGKADPNDPYSERVPIGEKLSIRDKIGENIGIYFDHVFRFDRITDGAGKDRFTVQFRGEIARTSFAALPDGKIDITGKSFYEVMMSYLKKGA